MAYHTYSLIETPNNSTSVLYYFNIQDGGALWENDDGLQGQGQSLEEGRMYSGIIYNSAFWPVS